MYRYFRTGHNPNKKGCPKITFQTAFFNFRLNFNLVFGHSKPIQIYITGIVDFAFS